MLATQLHDRRERRLAVLGCLLLAWLLAVVGAAVESGVLLAIGLAATGALSIVLAKGLQETIVRCSQVVSQSTQMRDAIARLSTSVSRPERQLDELDARRASLDQRLVSIERLVADGSAAIAALTARLDAAEAAATPWRVHQRSGGQPFGELGLREALDGLRFAPES